MNDSKELNVDELLTMLEEMQDQNDNLQELLKTEKEKSSEAQETISNLSSENSLLRSELQRKSEIIVSQNEKLGMLQKSDQVLEENLRLRKSNSVLKEQNSRIKKEAEAEVAAAKQKAADTMAALSDREKRISDCGIDLRKRRAAFDEEVKSYAEVKIRDKTSRIKNHYDASVKQLSAEYSKKIARCRGIMFLSVMYGIIITMITALKNKVFVDDVISAFEAVGNGIAGLVEWIVKAGKYVASYGDRIPQPITASAIHWFLQIIVIMALAIVCISIVLIPMCKYIGFFKEKQTDEISLLAGLIALAVVAFASDEIKSFASINLVFLTIILFMGYSFIRGIIQIENTDIRNGILKIGVIAGGIIAGMGIMAHFFGICGIVAVPVGIMLSIDNH